MNVLYIVGGEGNRYGSEIIAIDLISAGKKNGINYTVVTANKGAVSEACDRLGVDNYTVPFTFFVYKALHNRILHFVKRSLWRIRAEFLTNRAVKFIEKKIDIDKIDVIHTNLSRDLLGGILAKKYHKPHVWHIHELYKAHYQLTFLRPRQLEWMDEHADCFIAISKTVADEWIESGLSKNKMQIVYNGIDTKSIKAKADYKSGKRLKMVMVGHVVPAKGQEMVINNLSVLPDSIKKNVELDIIGEGSKQYKDKLIRAAQRAGVSISFLGYCSNLAEALQDYDIGINCSRGEGFGLSTVEYMAAGLCPVVANTGANEEIIQDNCNGFVFDFSGQNSFAKIIEHLYLHREEMFLVSKQARKDALERYSLENMQQRMLDQYHSVANA